MYALSVCEDERLKLAINLSFSCLSYLNAKEKEFLAFLLKKRLYEFTPIEVSKMLGVTNKTIINRCAKTNDKELFFLFHNSIIMV